MLPLSRGPPGDRTDYEEGGLMARNEARISVGIWSDPDFLALGPGAQRQYMFLISQPDISYAGVIPLRERRWSRAAAGLDVDTVNAVLAELAGAGFVVVDEDTEEVLVRSFMRRDEVHRQPNVLRAAQRAVGEITSPAIRAALVPELERMATTEGLPEASARIIADLLGTLRRTLPGSPPEGQPEPPANPMPNPSAIPSRQDLKTEGGGGNGTAVSSDSPFPLLPDPPPSSVPPSAGANPRRATKEPDDASETTAQTIVSEWIDRCRKRPPGQEIAKVGKSVKTMLAEGIDPDDVRRGVAAWMAKGLNPSTLPSVVNEVMNSRPGAPIPSLPSSPPAVPLAEQCPEHRGHRAGACGPCRADALARKAVTV
jgi:hypothetical protein